MQSLKETYDQAMARENVGGDNAYPMPISHTVQNAHINVVIDGTGNFKRAHVLEKTQIVLPATEKSAGRSSGEAAHALADKIQYVAADYAKFGGLKGAYFESYQAQLKDWVESEFSHPSLSAIYSYISKANLAADLLKEEILWAKDNVLLTSWDDPEQDPPLLFKVLPKEKGKLDQGSALVCWTVESTDVRYKQTWKDPILQQSWVDYDSQQEGVRSLCYVSGKQELIALNHPAKLRHSGDKAKLISSNDLGGYTYRGRFTDSKKSIESMGLQAASISLLTTQKSHNALRWLINRKKNTFKNGDQAIVAWATSNMPLPSVMGDSIDDDEIDWMAMDDEESTVKDTAKGKDEFKDDLGHDIGNLYARKLASYMRGYKKSFETDLKADDSVSIMAIDSATPGRMGVTYYRKSMPSDYLDDIHAWHSDFSWPQRVTKEVEGKKSKETLWRVQAPAPYTILQCIHGDIIKGSESLKKQFYQRMLPCLVERACIPQDILQLSLNQACKSTNKDYWEWERNLGVACALYKSFYARHPIKSQRREVPMSLDVTITSKDYLYGRLLALAEKLEATALSVSNVNRPTSANRLMQRFSDRPYSTWLTIYKQLDPYVRQLSSSRPGFLVNIQKEIDDVIGAFAHEDFIDDQALKGEFLLGFHCQRLALRKNKNSETTTQGE